MIKEDLLLAAALTLMVAAAHVVAEALIELLKIWLGSGFFDFR